MIALFHVYVKVFLKKVFPLALYFFAVFPASSGRPVLRQTFTGAFGLELLFSGS